MLKLFFSLLLMFFSLIMFFITHPLSMGLFILIQTSILTMYIGLFINSYWFSYILFMVFMGGLLVLFIYVASIASNELLKMSFMMKNLIIFSIIITMMISMMYVKNINMNLMLNNEMNELLSMNFFYNENKINLSKLYDKHNYFFTMLLVIYLFITLISVIKITNIFFGPLRSFN